MPPPYQHRDHLPAASAAALQQDLETQLAGEVRFDRVFCAMHSTDASVYQITPLGVVAPRSNEDVVRTVHLCNHYNASITARGGGTSQAGQAIGPGIQLDFSKYMDRILEVNPEEGWARVEPGVVLDQLNRQLISVGMKYAPDPVTSNRSCIGGGIGNNSCGSHSVIYGKTSDHIRYNKNYNYIPGRNIWCNFFRSKSSGF